MIDKHKNVLIVLIHFFHSQKSGTNTFRCFHFLNPLFQILLPPSELPNHRLHHLFSIFNLFLPTYAFLSECSQIFLILKTLPLSQCFTPFPITSTSFSTFTCSVIPHLHYNLAFTGLTIVSKRFGWKKWIWRGLHMGKSVLKKQKVVCSVGICSKTRNI